MLLFSIVDRMTLNFGWRWQVECKVLLRCYIGICDGSSETSEGLKSKVDLLNLHQKSCFIHCEFSSPAALSQAMPNTNEPKRGHIKHLLLNSPHASINSISKQANCSWKTVKRVKDKMNSRHGLHDAPRSGRPARLTGNNLETFEQTIKSEKDRKSTRLNSSHSGESRMPSSA